MRTDLPPRAQLEGLDLGSPSFDRAYPESCLGRSERIIQIRLATGYPDLFSSEAGAELWAWVQAVSGIADTTFLVALGSYVLLWLRVRQGSGSHP